MFSTAINYIHIKEGIEEITLTSLRSGNVLNSMLMLTEFAAELISRHMIVSTQATGNVLAARGLLYSEDFPHQKRDMFKLAGAKRNAGYMTHCPKMH